MISISVKPAAVRRLPLRTARRPASDSTNVMG
jgi:hypothetical protein